MLRREAVAEERQQLGDLVRELLPGSTSRPRRSTCAVSGSVPGARPRARSMRPGYIASSVRKVSATLNAAWFGSMMPAAPTRIVEVFAATCAVRISGALHARLRMLWCSETQ